MKELKTDEVVLWFLREGHFFIPGTEKGIGEVTYLCAGDEIFYVKCTTETFLKKLADKLCMDLRRLREFSSELTGQKKLVPLILSKEVVLLPFIHLLTKNRHHRQGYLRLSSIESCGPALLPNTCNIKFHKSRKMILLRLSVRRLIEHMSKARFIRDYYADLFRPTIPTQIENKQDQVES